jgi:arylsulfatase A-like enzyme
VSLADLAPTALSVAGLPVPEGLDGVDLAPVMAGGRQAAHGEVFVEVVDDPGGIRLKTVVTERYKLTHCHGERFGELYDLEADPGEIVNRWADPGLARVRADLLARIIDFSERLEPRAARYDYA